MPSFASSDSNDAYLVLGSNIEPEQNLPAAAGMLAEYGTVCRVSRVWESPPADRSDQANYLNAAVLLRTPLNPYEIRSRAIDAIEQRLGRRRDPSDRYAARTIDIDLALFNSEELEYDGRRIPDPDILTRAFVAVPLAELSPDYVHPVTGRTLAEIAATFEPSGLIARDDVRLVIPDRAPE